MGSVDNNLKQVADLLPEIANIKLKPIKKTAEKANEVAKDTFSKAGKRILEESDKDNLASKVIKSTPVKEYAEQLSDLPEKGNLPGIVINGGLASLSLAKTTLGVGKDLVNGNFKGAGNKTIKGAFSVGGDFIATVLCAQLPAGVGGLILGTAPGPMIESLGVKIADKIFPETQKRK